MLRRLFFAIKHRFFLTLILMVALALQACVAPRLYAAGEEYAHEQIFATVEPFYSWVLAHRSVSLPSDKDRSELAGFLMPELIQLIKDADEMEGRCIKAAAKGDKPMIFEGAFFAGIYEGATEVAYDEPNTDKLAEGIVILPLILAYIDETLPKASRFRAVAWNEELELRQKEGKWLVNNINFPYGMNLRSTLQNYLKNSHQFCIVP